MTKRQLAKLTNEERATLGLPLSNRERYAAVAAGVDRRIVDLDPTLSDLVGGTIIAAGTGSWRNEVPPNFMVKMPDGRVFSIEVMQDDEGNGPGAVWVNFRGVKGSK